MLFEEKPFFQGGQINFSREFFIKFSPCASLARVVFNPRKKKKRKEKEKRRREKSRKD